MSQTNIKCENCGASVIPRLLHTNDNFYTYSFTQHLCPMCGTVMYETGGEIKTEYKVITLALIIIFGLGALQRGEFSLFFGLLSAFVVVSILAFPTASGKVVKRIKKLIVN